MFRRYQKRIQVGRLLTETNLRIDEAQDLWDNIQQQCSRLALEAVMVPKSVVSFTARKTLIQSMFEDHVRQSRVISHLMVEIDALEEEINLMPKNKLVQRLSDIRYERQNRKIAKLEKRGKIKSNH